MTNISYEIACSKGWHDSDELGPDGTPSARQRLAWVALILPEWAEIQEDSYRIGIYDLFNGKPIGELSEYVDVWVRCADALGACGESLDGELGEIDPGIHRDFDLICFSIGKAAECTRTGDHAGYASWLRTAMFYARTFAPVRIFEDGQCVNFDSALVAKEAYNRTRTQRHGGKLA